MARLNALPYATMCIACQRDVERTGAGPAGREAGESREELAGDLEIDVS
jgi:RNA polymerase-binding transcription factor DksA